MSRFMFEVMDALSDAGWLARPKNDGYLCVPPVARPGHESIFIKDPGSDSGRRKIVISKLRQAGFKFEEKSMTPKSNGNGTASHIPAVAETPYSSPYVKLRARVGEAIEALSKVEQSINEIEADGQQAQEKLAGLRKLGLLV